MFGNLIFPSAYFERFIDPLLTLLNIIAGFGIISQRKRHFGVYVILFLSTATPEVFRLTMGSDGHTEFKILRFALLSLYYTIITLEIIRQVWFASEVNKAVIFGVMGGYVSLGLIGFFLVLGIEMAEPGSFLGLDDSSTATNKDDLFYFAYITQMTIGFGDIAPASHLAKKATILIGLLGQFYLVIITAVVVGKYINSEWRGN